MLRPITLNGFTFGVLPGVDYVAHEVATGIESKIRIADWQGGYYEHGSDGRYVSVASIINQGKAGIDDLVVAIFDCQQKAWVNFGAQPPSSLFHPISGPANPNWLWIKNGGQVSGFPGNPGGSIGRVSFVSVGEIEWVTTEPVDAQGSFFYKRWQRAFTETGQLGPFGSELDSDPRSLADTRPEPAWF